MTDEPELNETAEEMPVEETEVFDEQAAVETQELFDQPEVSVLVQVPEVPIPPGEREGAHQNASLNPDDVGADSDLVRPSRATQFRAQRRLQLSNTLPALLLIAAGVLLLLRPDAATRLLVIVVAVSGIALSLALRFLFNGRRERGLFFIAVMILLLTGIIGAAAKDWIDLSQGWPLVIMVPGAGMILTFIFERSHDQGLLLPGLMFIVAGGVILLFTTYFLDPAVLSIVALYWPVLLLVLALAVLPSAVRDRAG
jgi:hypothetical protein